MIVTLFFDWFIRTKKMRRIREDSSYFLQRIYCQVTFRDFLRGIPYVLYCGIPNIIA